jgi:vancomycin resistance protein VanW
MSLRDATARALVRRRAARAALGARRLARWWTGPGWDRPVLGDDGAAAVLWRQAIPISRGDVDPRLDAGKRRNLALAAPAFDGIAVSAERPLSFWRALGAPTRARGFQSGIEIAGGCVVPSPGGGLCLLSNALFALAVELGWTVVERHGHTVALADPRALDATVAWPHVDLRIAPRRGVAVLAVAVRGDALHVTARGARDPGIAVELAIDTARAGDGWVAITVRRRIARDGVVIEDAMIVADRKRRREPAAPLRTCVDCGELACLARRAV